MKRAGWAALLAIPLLLLAPATNRGDVARYLEPAARLLGALPAGVIAEAPPSWTTWITYPVAGVEVLRGIGASGSAASRLASASRAWTRVLRAAWAWMLGFLLLEVAGFTVAFAAPRRGTPPRPAGVATPSPFVALLAWGSALAVAGSPFASLGIAHLLPAVPAALLLLLLPRAPGWRSAGGLAGLLLAWFGFAWPVTVLAFGTVLCARRPSPGGKGRAELMRAVALAAFLALALVPERLLHPGAAPARFVAEWLREGGLEGPGGGGWAAVPVLAVALGPIVWVGWLGAAWRDRHDLARLLLPGGAVLACLLLPFAFGVRRPGAVQWCVVPLLASWAISAPLSLALRSSRRAGLGAALVLVLVASVFPARWAVERGASSSALALERLRGEIGGLVRRGDLVVAELDPFASAGADSSAGSYGYLVLPRDSRIPGRYDDLYWHRWYAGFRWVLLSGSRVSENLDREGAVLPRGFYRALESAAHLEREWGEGENGFRLYRIPDDSPWRRTLTESETGTLRPAPERAWFLSRLGSLYLESGNAPLAEEIFRLSTAWDPANPGTWNNLGAAFLRRGDYPAAAKAFDSGLRVAPGSFELLLNYGRACSAQGLFERGEGFLVRALNLRPDYAPVHYELARVFLGQGKDRAAEAALRHTLELDPQNARRAEIEAVLAHLAETAPSTGAKR